MTENDISYKIIGAAIELHKILGPGLLESVYETALEFELKKLGLDVKRQVSSPFVYKGIKFKKGYRMDLFVNNKVIIEIKATSFTPAVHYAQLLTYLKLNDVKLGLLINFNSKKLINGVHRVVNNL